MTTQLDILLEDDQPPLKKGLISLSSDLNLSDSDTESLPDLLSIIRPAKEQKDTPVLPPNNNNLNLLNSLRPAWYQDFSSGSFKELTTLLLQDATALRHLPEHTHSQLLPVLTKLHQEFVALLEPNLQEPFVQMRPLSEYL